jgi:hypothetical protein
LAKLRCGPDLADAFSTGIDLGFEVLELVRANADSIRLDVSVLVL